MCCQFFVDENTERQVSKLLGRTVKYQLKGVIHPQDPSLVLCADGELKSEEMRWGFVAPEKKHLVINARSETVKSRPMFCDSFLTRRCAIPASVYYEWDRNKEKVEFERSDDKLLYLAGIYRREVDMNHFTVLTVGAENEAAKVHDRMPLLLEEGQLEQWFLDEKFSSMLYKTPRPAVRYHYLTDHFEQIQWF